MKFPLLVRAAAIGAVTLLLVVPLQMIRDKVKERQARAQEVLTGYWTETTGMQVIAGPFLALTCEETYSEDRDVKRGGKVETVSETRTRACPTAFFLPRTLLADADVPVETLHRGIYSIRTYRATAHWQGEFEWPALPESTWTGQRRWKQAYLATVVRDARGVKEVRSSIPGSLSAKAPEATFERFALRQAIGAWDSRPAGSKLAFEYHATIAGFGSFQIAPIADANEIRLRSDWPHPSFSRGWSPDQREITPQGFRATWHVNSIATSGNATWKRIAQEGVSQSVEGVGVSLFDPVNTYSLSYRATEYGFLFILFTFATFAAAEALTGVRLHPIQYGLVGCALAVFFLLLLALSEHVRFVAAYGSAALACSTLNAYYLRHALRSVARAGSYFAGFVSMYSALYFMLRSEDNALLIGSVLVFALLAAVMFATRKLDWASLGSRLGATPARP